MMRRFKFQAEEVGNASFTVKVHTKVFCSGSLLLLVIVLLSANSLSGQEMAVTPDPTRTEIDYTLGATVHTVHGTFRLKSGSSPPPHSVRDNGSGRSTFP